MVGRLQVLLTVLAATAAVGGVIVPADATPNLADPETDQPDANDVVDDSTDDSGSNDSNDSEPNESTEPDEVDSDDIDRDRESNVRVDDVVILVDYAWDADAEVFRLTFESDRPRQITVTESVQQPEGAGTFDIRQERLEDGLTEIAIPVEPSGGEVAVSITTSASIQQGGGVYVSTGVTEQQSGPWSNTSSAAGWFGGLSVALSMMIAAAWQQKRRIYEEPEGYQ